MNPEELLAHSSFLNAISYKLVFDKSTANDIRQDVYLAALQHAPTDDKNLKAWLARLARNMVRMRYRSERSRRRREGAYAGPEIVPSTVQIVQEEDLRRKVVEEVLKLEEPLKSAIVLRYYRDLSMKETARSLGLSLPTLRRRLKKGIDTLRMRLDETQNGRKNWLSVLVVPAMSYLASMRGRASEKRGGFLPLAAKTAGVAAISILAILCVLWAVIFWQPEEKCEYILTSDFRPIETERIATLSPESSIDDKREKVRLEPRDHSDDFQDSVDQVSGRIIGRVLDESGSGLSAVSVRAINLLENTYKTGDWNLRDVDLTSGLKDFHRTLTHFTRTEKTLSQTTSGTLGKFEVSLSIPDTQECRPIELVFEKEGYVSKDVEATVFKDRSVSVKDVIMRPAGQAAGRVLTQDGEPVRDATLLFTDGKPLWLFDDEQYDLFGPEHTWGVLAELVGDVFDLSPPTILKEARTDDDGRFLIKGLPPGWGRVWANAFGTYYSHTGLVDIRKGYTSSNIELRLKPLEDLWKINVQVLDPDGNPYPNAEVGYIFKTENQTTRISEPVDEQGLFRGINLGYENECNGGNIQGFYTFVAQDKEGHYGSVRIDNIPLGSTNPIVLKLKSDRPCFTLNPKTSAGTPIEGIHVKIEADCDLFDNLMDIDRISEKRNSLSFPIPLSPFEVIVSAEGFHTEHAGPFMPENTPERIDLTLNPVSGLQGMVLAGGVPSPDTHVTLHKAVDPDFRYMVEMILSLYERDKKADAMTDSSGHFRLYTDRTAYYYIRAEKTGYAPTDYGPVMIDPESGVKDIVLCLEKPGAIQGRVQAGPGENVSGLCIAASREDAFPLTTRTDPNGCFTFRGLTPGRWKVMQWSWDIPINEEPTTHMVRRAPGIEKEEYRFVCSVAPGKITIYNLTLSPGTSEDPCRIQGQLLIDGKPPTGWIASLKEAGSFPFSTALAQGPVDREGRFVIDHEGTGIYDLCLYGDTSSGNTLWVLDEVDLTKNNPYIWEADLSSATCRYSGNGSQDTLWYKWQGSDGSSAYTRLNQVEDEYLAIPAGTGKIVNITPILVSPYFSEECLKTVSIEAGSVTTISE